MGAVCLLAVCLSLFSIFSLYRMRETASLIYEHPFTVATESRAMSTRLRDMRSFLLQIIGEPDTDPENVCALLHERYEMHYASIEVIRAQYLGPEEDVERLLSCMQELERIQNEALPYILPMTVEETAQYVSENFYPQYDAVDQELSHIGAFADQQIRHLEKKIENTAFWAMLSAGLLTIFLPSYFLAAFWRERKGMQEVQYREHLFDVLSTNVDEVFLIFNQQKGAVEYVSANCRRILDVEEDGFLKDARMLQDRVAEKDRPLFMQFIRPNDTGEGRSCEIQMRFPGSELRWIRLQSFPEIVDGAVTRHIVSISDQTQIILKEQALKDALVSAQNANAAKRNFLSRMSHEIRTPMNAIIGMTTIAGAYIDDRQRVEDCLEKIGYSSKHLMTLINDILDMSKIDEGKMTISQETFDLESIAGSITSIIYPQAAEKGLTFTMPLVDITDTLLVGDPLRLNQILLNLLSNALKFTPTGGSIRLEIRQLQKKHDRVRLRFTVSDTGVGMSEEFMERLFLPFEQESAATGRKYGGTGLGMSITKNLVNLMGGTIAVKSEPGKGSVFEVELDLGLPPEAQRTISQDERTLGSLKVLVTDDDRDTCLHTTLLLENLGILARWVLTGEACVEEVLSAHRIGEDYDVCLIDWKMADMDGIEVTHRVREFVGPDVTIIIITAYDYSAIEQSAREAGANAFLAKPIFPSALYNTLLAATGRGKVLPGAAREKAPPALAGRRVLLAEDNELNREIAVEVLKMAGVEVECAVNGQEAAERFLADSGRYDLILMDLQMPVVDGYQATHMIRTSGDPRAASVPIIAMTADAFHEDMVKAMEAGMNGHLAKPVDPARLYNTLEEVLEQHQKAAD